MTGIFLIALKLSQDDSHHEIRVLINATVNDTKISPSAAVVIRSQMLTKEVGELRISAPS